MKRGILSVFIFTGVWAALWDTPEADLSLARLHITNPAGAIQNRPGFLVNVSGITSLTSLYLEDTSVERTSSLPIINGYPEAQVSLRFGRFELGLSGEQTLDAGGKIWERDSLGISRSLDIYRLSAEVAWWPTPRMSLVAGYNHHLGWLTREEKDSTASQVMEAFGHTTGFSAGLLLALTERLQLDLVLHSPTTPLQLKGTCRLLLLAAYLPSALRDRADPYPLGFLAPYPSRRRQAWNSVPRGFCDHLVWIIPPLDFLSCVGSFPHLLRSLDAGLGPSCPYGNGGSRRLPLRLRIPQGVRRFMGKGGADCRSQLYHIHRAFRTNSQINTKDIKSIQV